MLVPDVLLVSVVGSKRVGTSKQITECEVKSSS